MTTTSRSIDAATLQERLRAHDVRLIDVRTPAEYDAAHIAGSYNVPLAQLREHREELSRHLDDEVVLVCRSGARAGQAEQSLAAGGLPGLRILEGGISAWEAAGAPVERGRQTWDLERQVRLAAGGLVAAAVAGSAVVPRMKWLAGGVGTGLVVAALTDTCAMGAALARMPWNAGTRECDVREVLTALSADR
jgi:rhodanese-related sulfurtransferase